MPKQEYKILEFHGGTNNKFDPRDIGDNQNAESKLSIRKPGRLVVEGSAKTLYSKTDLNGHPISDITASPGGYETGYGLFSFSHDYEMASDIIQDGTDVDTDDSNWAAVNSDGSGTVAWNNASPSVFDTSANEDASIYNTLGGNKLEANSKYILTFDIVTATLNLAIGGGDASGNTADATYVAAADYTVGTHSVTFIPSASATHLWFTADSSEISADGSINNISCLKFPDEVETDFICINDKNGIDIYDPNQSTEWQQDKFLLGSRTATVKPEYYNVDGALRVCDSNFDVTDASADTSAPYTKNDVILAIDNGAASNVTIATGSVIQIDQEIMYVTSGGTGQSFTVIRGFANTKISTHADNTNVYYVNIPKYFGHIKADRLFECATSNSVNTWAEDAQTPQPPNNTRKGDSTTGALASSAGVQSLRIYNSISGSTLNYPAESEKVVLEFGESPANVGIIRVQYLSENRLKFTTSGYGNNASAGNKLSHEGGQEIFLSRMQGAASVLNGTHDIVNATDTTFEIDYEGASSALDVNFSDAAHYKTTIDDWFDHSEAGEIDNVLRLDTNATGDTRFILGTTGLSAEDVVPVHITGEASVNAFNGVYQATIIDDDECYITHGSNTSFSSGGGAGKLQLLVGVVSPEGSENINEDLKRKWNFAMSFTYDGPAQEVQESLLTEGYTIYESRQADNESLNTLTTAISATGTTSIVVNDTSVFTAGESVIMLDSEQMLVSSITNSTTMVVTRGYNGTTKDDDIAQYSQIYDVKKLSTTATVDWTNFVGVPKCVIKSVYDYGQSNKSWNPRINGFKIYMKDVTEEDASKEWRLFSHVNFNKGTYTLFAAGDSELILEQPSTSAIATLTEGTDLTIKPIDTYLSENLFTEDTIIDAQYKCAETIGRRTYIGNIRQGGRTYPDRMLRTPVNKFDTFPETNFIDVAIGDGDRIVALKSFGDRLLQFKKDTVYVINVSGESEVLEAEYPNAGIAKPSQVVKTNKGIMWFNPSGLWLFDGQSINNVIKHLEDGKYPDHETNAGIIGFDKYTNRVIYTPRIMAGQLTAWYMYDLELQAFQASYTGALFAHSASGANYYTNIINDSDGNMIVGFVDEAFPTELNFYQWSNDATEGQGEGVASYLWKSKDIDLSSPAMNKKIYKVYVTYKCTGHSGVAMKYATNGGSTYTDFSSSSSSNYDVQSFSSNGQRTGFQNTSGEWAVAELKPSSSINNVKSIQLVLSPIFIDDGTAQNGGGTDSIVLASDLSATAGAFNDYNINIDGGLARYNTRVIENGTNGTTYSADGSSRLATVLSAFTDNGYGNSPDNTTKYILGAVAPDFEINDITIIFRPKPIK